ncbi:MAG: hydroxymethylglutaryl-CoA reductase, degradative [Candidatus Kariarchaeaceae archaeon]
MDNFSSELSGFYKLSIEERQKKLQVLFDLTEEELVSLNGDDIDLKKYDRMIENVCGVYSLPFGIATNFKVNNKDYLVPMVIEEASVVAAASHAAKIARKQGGFTTSNTGPVMIAQIQVVDLDCPSSARVHILHNKDEIIALANQQDAILVKLGGGAKDVKARVIETITGTMLIVELLVDVRDAMGANAVNTMAEAVKPLIEKISKGRVILRILSNLAELRLIQATAVFDCKALGGEEVVRDILHAYSFAEADPYRAATHNKGIMNGIIALTQATGNDTRAVEAGAHAYASRFGKYTSLSTYEINEEGHLVGTLEIPMAIGVFGGLTNVHPIAKLSKKILGVKTATELAEVATSLGLAQNLAALRALAAEGIQKGHMSLHARNVAASIGAEGNEIEEIAREMINEGKVNTELAMAKLEKIRK